MPDGNRTEAERWFRQAERDLDAASASKDAGSFDWACFQSQQGAEKAVKSVLYRKGYRKILSHSVYELILGAVPHCEPLKPLSREAKTLDNVYIAARYPNGITGSLIPAEYYTEEDATECLKSAGLILDAVRDCMKK
jgi:HEPN domain-containing protein